MKLEDLQTGDILLISDYQSGFFNYFLSLIRWATKSDYVHIGMIIKDPPFNKELKGTYVWESGYEGVPDPQDGKIKLGVQLTHIDTMIKNLKTPQNKNTNIFVRRLHNNTNVFSDFKFNQIHKIVYDKVYDLNIKDWYDAWMQRDSKPQKTDRFWCSAFVGFIYTKLGILDENSDWSIMRPCDFALDGENLNYATTNTLQAWEERLDIDS